MINFFKKKSSGSLVLAASADAGLRAQIVKYGEKEGHEVVTADSGSKALAAVRSRAPDLIMIDSALPDIAGVDMAARLHENETTAYIPVVLIVDPHESLPHSRIVAAGVDDILTKPVDKKEVLAKIETGLKWNAHWKEISRLPAGDDAPEADDFKEFKKFLGEQLQLGDLVRAQLATASPAALYAVCSRLGVGSHQAAQLLAHFLKLPYADSFAPEDVLLGSIPLHLARAYGILPVKADPGGAAILHSNPFLPRFPEVRQLISAKHPQAGFLVCDPHIIDLLFQGPEYEEAF